MKKQALLLSAIATAFANAHNAQGDDLILRELARAQSQNYHNFSGNNSPFGFNADELASNPDLARLMMALSGRGGLNFDADAMNYDADALNYMGLGAFGFSVDEMLKPEYLINKGRMRYTAQEIAAANLTTFKARIVYIPNGVTPAEPVKIQLFGMTFGEDFTYDVKGNLVFTNANGDTVEVRGLTRSMKQLYAVTDTEPFRLAFARITPQSTSQLDNPIKVENQTQWNSGKFNEINPDIYNDPYQYQQLNIDVPFNMLCDKKNGFTWDIDPDQSAPGIGFALFISQQLKPADALSGKDPIRNLNMGQATPFTVPSIKTSPVKQQLAMLAQSPAVKDVIANSALIKTRG